MSGRMAQYGIEHIGALVVIAVAAVVCLRAARRASDEERIDRTLRTFGWAMLAVSALWTLWGLLPANFDLSQSLPFHFSDAMRYLTGIALITRSGWSIVLLYYWGLTLNLQSVLTPDLNYLQFPVLEFVMYWLLHGVVLIVPIVLIWGLGYRPTWLGYAAGLGATVVWSGIAYIVNLVTGANYSYVGRAPDGASLLDLLGPWPTYLLSVAALMVVVWALMTWPWTTAARSEQSTVVDRFGLIRRRAVGAPVPA